jgi:hypothetical protein
VTSADIKVTERFKAGGTLHGDAPSYVTRPADDELFERVLKGEYCYILTARQMGKSSLMIRTAERLRQQGFQAAIVDLSGLGTLATAEQWYLGIVKYLAQDLYLAIDPEEWWQEQSGITPVQRFDIFLHDVVLAETARPIVVFIDEIDSTLKLPFADDFFATIRRAYNLRAQNPAYDRLTFVLLGVVAPTDLIKDRTRTPFNIGHAINLQEFSRADVGPLETEIERLYPGQGRRILDQIFYWTSGHPYLTQKLCQEIAGAPARAWTNAEIDRLIEALFLGEAAQQEDNIQFVNNYVEASPERRQLVQLYRQIYAGKTVPEDERSPVQNRLKLAGLIRAKDGALQLRNQIYRQVFNGAWIKRNTPVNIFQTVTVIAVTVIVVAIGVAVLVVYQRRQEAIHGLQEHYQENNEPEKVEAQMYWLIQFCGDAQKEAQDMFFDHTDPHQQQRLFSAEALTSTSPDQLSAVVDCLAPEIERRVPQGDDRIKLAGAMCGALYRFGDDYNDQRYARLCAARR